MLTVQGKDITMQMIQHFPPNTLLEGCILYKMIQYADAQVRRSFWKSFSNVATHLCPLYLPIFPTLSIKYQLSLLHYQLPAFIGFDCFSFSGTYFIVQVPIKTNSTCTLLLRPFLIHQWKYLPWKGRKLMYVWSEKTPAVTMTWTFRKSPADQQQLQKSYQGLSLWRSGSTSDDGLGRGKYAASN